MNLGFRADEPCHNQSFWTGEVESCSELDRKRLSVVTINLSGQGRLKDGIDLLRVAEGASQSIFLDRGG